MAMSAKCYSRYVNVHIINYCIAILRSSGTTISITLCCQGMVHLVTVLQVLKQNGKEFNVGIRLKQMVSCFRICATDLFCFAVAICGLFHNAEPIHCLF